ncbi:MAG: hypothetical protein NVS4B11_21170 [Ktedonobacteraceae bacterium]
MKRIQNGLIAGLFAGLILAVLFFADYGPGGLLHMPARWLALDSKDAGKFVGFLLFIVLGGVFGVLFGAIEGRRAITLGRSLVLGAATGVLFWLIIPLLFGTIINHMQLSFGDFLYSFVPLILYGVLLGSFSFQRETRTEYIQRT